MGLTIAIFAVLIVPSLCLTRHAMVFHTDFAWTRGRTKAGMHDRLST